MKKKTIDALLYAETEVSRRPVCGDVRVIGSLTFVIERRITYCKLYRLKGASVFHVSHRFKAYQQAIDYAEFLDLMEVRRA